MTKPKGQLLKCQMFAGTFAPGDVISQ